MVEGVAMILGLVYLFFAYAPRFMLYFISTNVALQGVLILTGIAAIIHITLVLLFRDTGETTKKSTDTLFPY